MSMCRSVRRAPEPFGLINPGWSHLTTASPLRSAPCRSSPSPSASTDLAAADPDRPRSPAATTTVTRAELERRRQPAGRDLQSRGVGVGDMVTIALPNSVDWFVAVAACWKLGAIPQPVSSRLPGARARGDRRAGRPDGRRRRRAGAFAGPRVPARSATRRPTTSTTRRCPTRSRRRGRRRRRAARPAGRS